MILSLKKGTSYINVNYLDNDFSNNLYCSDINYIDGQLKIIEFSFEKILKSRADTNSKLDLKDLANKIDYIKSICFSDNTLKKRLLRRFKQNEKVIVRIISEKKMEIEMSIFFKDFDEFEFKKPAVNKVHISSRFR